MHRNIKSIIAVRQEFVRKERFHHRLIRHLTAFLGSAPFVAVQICFVTAWLAINIGWVRGIAPFDRFPFSLLGTVISVEGVLLATLVLVNQNRASELADKRADLDLQISLLSEHELTQVIRLTDAIARRLGVDDRDRHEELDELKVALDPQEVLAEIDRHEVEATAGETL